MKESRSALDNLDRRARRAELQRKLHDENKQAVQQQGEELESRIAAVRQKVSQSQQAKATGPSKYALIPYDGRTGTARRPILIECTDRGIRFIPEDVLLTEENLIGFTEAYNPLLAGSRALIDYWSAPARRAEGPEPYVLLIVRPSGAVAYYAARKLLGRLRQPCGYELLQEDWELDLPEADPGAKAALQKTIRQLLREREQVVHAVRGDPAAGRQAVVRRDGGSGFYKEDLDAIPPGGRGDGVKRTAELPNDAQSAAGGTGRGDEPPSRTDSRLETDSRHGSQSKMSDAADATGKADRPGGNHREQNIAATRRNSGAAGHASQPGERESPFPNFRQLPAGRPGSRKSAGAPQLRRWGLSNRGARIGFEREITVRVEADRLVVGRDFVVRIGEGQRQKDLIGEVIEAIDAHARSWGQAPESFYWVPSIRFLVSPGGNQHYERLHGPLSRFGLSSRVDFTLESSQPPRREGK